jgi:hypothetical protein
VGTESGSHEPSSTRRKAVLFHRRDEPDSEAARELVIQVDGLQDIDFEDVGRGSQLFEDLGGGSTPAFWDGDSFHEGLAAIVLALIPERPTTRRDMKKRLKAGSVPESYSFGEELDWKAPWVTMTYSVELPFWLMLADCNLTVRFADHDYAVEVRSDHWELYVGEQSPSSINAIYFGQQRFDGVRPDLMAAILERRLPYIWRRCRTVVKITSRCIASVAEPPEPDSEQDSRIDNVRKEYLRSMCELHLPVVNHLIQSYRMITYDYFPYEVSPWDVPVWYCVAKPGFQRVVLLPYSAWDLKPRDEDTQDEYSLTTPERLQAVLRDAVDPAEFELVDALNRMERGDYTGAVRRVTTAAEAELGRVLRAALAATRTDADVEVALRASRNDFPRRLREYEGLRGQRVPDVHRAELERTRTMRHEIVHQGMRIQFSERGRAQRAVDTGRWFFNWLQNDPQRTRVRESGLALRSLGQRLGGSSGHLGADGPVIESPASLAGSDQQTPAPSS